ncbi:MAG: macro domain-containing protein [Myxococcota bacterium]
MTVLVRIEVFTGDITTLEVDAIVNAANPQLNGGGGVDGAIHRAAGPALLARCLELGGCPTGEAKSTPAYELEPRVKHIIHTVGPVWGSDPDADGSEPMGYRLEDNQLSRAYQSSLEEARRLGARSLAFPCISTGVYGFPKDRAATIAFGHVRRFLEKNETPGRVVLACFHPDDAQRYLGLLGRTELLVEIGGRGTRRPILSIGEDEA